MKRKNVFLLLVICSVFQSVFSQRNDFINKTLENLSSELRFGNGRSVYYGTAEIDANIEGSEYMDENFVNGDIFTLEYEHFSNIPMRYNAYLDSLEVKLADGIIYNLTDLSKIMHILLGGKVMVYTTFISANQKSTGFLFELYNGKSSLYCRNNKILKERIPSNGIIPEVPPKIIDKPNEFYIRLNDGLPHIFSSKKDLLELLKSHSKEIEIFVKKEKIKIKKDDDIIKVLTYYDSLK